MQPRRAHAPAATLALVTLCALGLFSSALPAPAGAEGDAGGPQIVNRPAGPVGKLPPPLTPALDSALSFSSGGFVDTDFGFGKINGKTHSLSFRFMLKYPNSDYNAIIGESGGGIYTVSKTASASGGCDDKPSLSVNVGFSPGTYHRPAGKLVKDEGLAEGRWYDVVLTVDAGLKARLYIDGAPAERRGRGAAHQLTSAAWASGVLRFGRRNNGVTPPDQFYGLLDDVSVWDRELTEAEVKNLNASPKLKGDESGLLSAWNFNTLAKTAAAGQKLNRPLALNGGSEAVRLVAVTGKHEADAARMTLADHATTFSTPVKGDWLVVQGADSDNVSCPAGGAGGGWSHRGYASFCVDLIRADDPDSGDNAVSTTRGQPIFAVADGRVILIRDTSPDDVPNQQVKGCQATCADKTKAGCGYISNEVAIEHAPNEVTSYLHLKPGSVPDSVKKKLAGGQLVRRGEKIGEVGRSGTGGNHLHLAMGWALVLPANVGLTPGEDKPITTGNKCGYTPAVPVFPAGNTRPFQLTNYWAMPEGAAKFAKVSAGTPQLGEVIREMPPLAKPPPERIPRRKFPPHFFPELVPIRTAPREIVKGRTD